MGKVYKVLFVCLGNICRSMAAAGILRSLLEKERDADVAVDSCGLGDWHVGKPADPRMAEAAKERGYILKGQGKIFQLGYFDEFDLILAADKEVLKELWKLARSVEDKAKIQLISAFSSYEKGEDIPDPYHGGKEDFSLTLDFLEDACTGILDRLNAINNR